MKNLRRPFRYRYDNLVVVIIGLNVLVYLAQRFISPNLVSYLSLNPQAVFNGQIWRFVTYMFVHDQRSIAHIVFNMLALCIFGTQVERHIGSPEFLLYYLLTGIMAGVFSFAAYFAAFQLTGGFAVRYYNMLIFWFQLIGASGAVFAVQLAYAAFFPQAVIYIWGIIPLRAPIMVLAFTGISVVSMLTGFGGNVAHMTHLAGFGFGWLYFVVRFGINPWRAMRR